MFSISVTSCCIAVSFHFPLRFFCVQIIVIFINFNLLIGSMCLQMRCATMKSFVALLKVNGAGTYSICFLNLNFLSFCHVVFHVFHFVLCSLEGVKLFKTSVTYNSLGESVEPFGHVDNFFIAGYCRKLFDDSHPKESRKHFFYPRIGVCIVTMYYFLCFVCCIYF